MWTIFSPCSLSCGGGSQTRYRYCSDPPASHGGLPCSGNNVDTEQCNALDCPIGKKYSITVRQVSLSPLYGCNVKMWGRIITFS
jgi:hypothetical protein